MKTSKNFTMLKLLHTLHAFCEITHCTCIYILAIAIAVKTVYPMHHKIGAMLASLQLQDKTRCHVTEPS